jgi:TusA-related sulfurtransferase
MVVHQKIDLSQTVSFISLLAFRKAMAALESGDRLAVILADQDTVADLQRIVDHSQDQITHINNENGHYIIDIIKGKKKV